MMDLVKDQQLEAVPQGLGVGPGAGVGGHRDRLQLLLLPVPDADRHAKCVNQASIPLV